MRKHGILRNATISNGRRDKIPLVWPTKKNSQVAANTPIGNNYHQRNNSRKKKLVLYFAKGKNNSHFIMCYDTNLQANYK